MKIMEEEYDSYSSSIESSNITIMAQLIQLEDTIDSNELVVVLPIAVTIMLVGILSNTLVFFTIIASKRIQLRKQGFVISLTIADLLFYIGVFPLILSSLINRGWAHGTVLCYIQGFLACSSGHASIFGITMIALSRYFSIVQVPFYRKHFTPRMCIGLICVVWACAVALPIPALAGWGRIEFQPVMDLCVYDWTYRQSYTQFVLITGYLVPLFIIIYCYIGIFVTYMKSRKRIREWQTAPMTNQNAGIYNIHINQRVSTGATISLASVGSGAGGGSRGGNKSLNENWRLAGQLLAVFVAYLICWAPYILLASIIDPWTELDRTYYDVVANLMALNGIINPALYFFLNKTMRKEAHRLLCRKCRKGQNRVTSYSSTSCYLY